MAQKYAKSAAQARMEQLAANPPELSGEEREAIMTRMRVREMERFPLED